jgi:DNA repair photolyase
MTFSLNPEGIADLWEGKWSDGVRITPTVNDRLAASAKVHSMGFEIRWRIDPILPVDGWQDIYREFLLVAASQGQRPTRITLGTYREMGRSLLTLAAKWGLPTMEFDPGKLTKDGMHYHLPDEQRIEIYRQLVDFIRSAWEHTGHTPIVALCKETKTVRETLGVTHSHCNCE